MKIIGVRIVHFERGYGSGDYSGVEGMTLEWKRKYSREYARKNAAKLNARRKELYHQRKSA